MDKENVEVKDEFVSKEDMDTIQKANVAVEMAKLQESNLIMTVYLKYGLKLTDKIEPNGKIVRQAPETKAEVKEDVT